MADCLFCKIADGTIPAHKIFESERVIAFLDIHPHAPGHTVVIPKHHAPRLEDAAEEDVREVFLAVRTLARRLRTRLAADGLTVGVNEGAVSGQTVPHLHVHLFPRFRGDGGGSVHSIVRNIPRESLEEMVEKLK